MSGLTAVGYFLFSLFFSIITFVLWMRFALRYFRVSALHPISHSINTFTNSFVKPLGPLFKSSKTRITRYDWACFSALVIAELFKFTCINLFIFGTLAPWYLLVLYTLAELIIQPCNLLFYAILIRVIMSWINPHWRNPFADLIYTVTEPLLRKARSMVPVISGIDFSPFIVIIALKVITLFVGASLPPPYI